MAKVKAAYNYSYNYEGQKISFKKGEEFQLLTKSNKDWWQVRRWLDGCAQDIYVPAVYMSEVENSDIVVQSDQATYMNLDDLKIPKSYENGTKSTAGNKPSDMTPTKGNSLKKKNSLDRNKPVLVKKNSRDKEAPENQFPSEKSNGLNPARPVSPLYRLNSPGNTSQGSQVGQGSLKRGENLVPPPVSSKPRSKSINIDNTAPESSLDSGARTPQRQTSSGSGGSTKGKVPPPVQSKPRPQKVPVARPMSCVAPSSDFSESLEGNRPIVSELSNVLLKKNPHLAGEHKPLGKSSSSGTMGTMDVVPLASRGVGISGEGLSKSQEAKNFQQATTETQQNRSEEMFVAPPPPTSPPPLPAGWTEHKTSSGHTYYYNSASGQSLWTRPQGNRGGPEDKHLEKVAPRGWTKEINPITGTPVYTNSRTGDHWALGSDAKGNYFYYNMVNSSLTVGELPEMDVEPEENVYDSLLAVHPKVKGPSTPSSSPVHVPGRSASQPTLLLTETIASSLSDILKRHGYLVRKRVFDSHGKKAKERNWLKFYVTLQGYELLFYPDLKAKDAGNKPVYVFCLLQTTVSPYNKDRRKANVFQVSSHLGEQFLLQAETPNLMNEWYSTIQTSIDQANRDYKDNPDKFKSCLQEPLQEDCEGSPKMLNFKRGGDYKRSVRGSSRNQSLTDEYLLDDEDDPIDDMEISAAERSGHIRGRLRKLMARRPERESLKTKGILEDPVFGCELFKLCERQGTTVPKFFNQFTQHIEKVGLDVVGIYRLSGNAASINKLRYLLEQDQNIDLDSEEWSDVNIVTGCLKLYLRELPDPLIPFRLYKPLIEAARAPTQPQRIQQIATRVKDLPHCNYCTLKALLQHLRKVVEFGSVNKMLSTNVAIVFGPTVMRAETDSIEMATLMPIQNGIVEIMVNEYDSIFRK